MYTGPVEPGSTHDLTAAGLHVLPALYRSAWSGMPVLADKGYQGAGIGILVPTKNPCPTPDEQTRNNLLSAMRAPAERANAMFKHFRALQRVSPGPRDHHRDHGRRPRHHHPLARFLTRILVRKAHYRLLVGRRGGGARWSIAGAGGEGLARSGRRRGSGLLRRRRRLPRGCTGVSRVAAGVVGTDG